MGVAVRRAQEACEVVGKILDREVLRRLRKAGEEQARGEQLWRWGENDDLEDEDDERAFAPPFVRSKRGDETGDVVFKQVGKERFMEMLGISMELQKQMESKEKEGEHGAGDNIEEFKLDEGIVIVPITSLRPVGEGIEKAAEEQEATALSEPVEIV